MISIFVIFILVSYFVFCICPPLNWIWVYAAAETAARLCFFAPPSQHPILCIANNHQTHPENPCAYVDIKMVWFKIYNLWKYMIIWPPRSGLLHTFVAFSGSLSPFEQAIPMMTSKSELFKDGAEIVQWLKINGKGPS